MSARSCIAAVIGAFESASLVALGERHWAREDAEFRLRLIRHPDFAWKAQDIVVEFASGRHQDLLDGFMKGRDVLAAELPRVWRDTTQPGAWDSPVYEDFFRAVREVNGNLPPDRRLRVLAGDPGIDWDAVPEGPQLRRMVDQRDRFAAAVIEPEVLSRGRKALLVFGALHVWRNRPGSIVDLLRANSAARHFVIVPVGGEPVAGLISEPASPVDPVLVRLAESPVGGLEANDLFRTDTKRVKVVDGKIVLVPAQLFDAGVKARDVADAGLYFGGAPPEMVPRPEWIAGSEYGREIDRRRSILTKLPPG